MVTERTKGAIVAALVATAILVSQVFDFWTERRDLRIMPSISGLREPQLSLWRLMTHMDIAWHFLIATACLLFIGWLAVSTATAWRPKFSPEITTAEARQKAAGKVFGWMLPHAANRSYHIQLHALTDLRVWRRGIAMFLVTAMPYWLLFRVVGKQAIYSPLKLAYELTPHWLFAAIMAASALILARIVVSRVKARRHYRGKRDRTTDGPLHAAIAYTAGAEHWSASERFRACLAFSLALQVRYVFPLFPVFTFFTAMISHRLFMGIYLKELARTGSHDDALSHLVTVRTVRLASAAAGSLITVLVLIFGS